MSNKKPPFSEIFSEKSGCFYDLYQVFFASFQYIMLSVSLAQE